MSQEDIMAENVAAREPHASDCKNPYTTCDGTYIVYTVEDGGPDIAGLIECVRCGYTPNGADYV
jgi:hypothetical protein